MIRNVDVSLKEEDFLIILRMYIEEIYKECEASLRQNGDRIEEETKFESMKQLKVDRHPRR